MGAVSRSVRSISSEAGPGFFLINMVILGIFWGYFGDILGIFWGYFWGKIHFFRQIQMICPIVQAADRGKFGHLQRSRHGDFCSPHWYFLLSRKTIRSGSFLDTPKISYIFNTCGSFFWGEHAETPHLYSFPGGKPTEIQWSGCLSELIRKHDQKVCPLDGCFHLSLD